MSSEQNTGGVTSLDAVVLIANDFDAQVEFYEKALGLSLRYKGSDYAFFVCGQQTLALFSRSHHKQGTARLGGANHGISHLEFGLPAALREKMFQRLNNAGARAYGENFEDADGNLFHFNFY